MHPPSGSTHLECIGDRINNVFYDVVLSGKEKGTVHTDVIGALPVISLE